MIWSTALSVSGVFGLYLTTRKLAIGFAVGLIVQVMWTIYSITTAQYGFLISVVLFGTMHSLGLYKWTRKTPNESEEPG